MNQNLIELLDTSLKNLYGSLIAKVFTTLAANGRLTAAALIQRSRLPAQKVKYVLVVLIQNHLVFHYSTGNHPNRSISTSYEVNWLQAYNISIRAGKIQEFAATAVGVRDSERARHVVLKLLELGHASIAHLRELLVRDQAANADLHLNGALNGEHNHETDNGKGQSRKSPSVSALPAEAAFRSYEELNSTIHQLVLSGFIVLVNEHVDFKTKEDLHTHALEDLADRDIKEDDMSGKTKGARQEEFQAKVKDLKTEWQSYTHSHYELTGLSNKKRKASPEVAIVAAPVKKRRITKKQTAAVNDNALANGNGITITKPVHITFDDLVVRLSFEKLAVATRNQWLVKQANRYVGDTTAKVYEALLAVLERQITSCYNSLADSSEIFRMREPRTSATTPQILHMLKEKYPLVDLDDGLADASHWNGDNYYDSTLERNGQDAVESSDEEQNHNSDERIHDHDPVTTDDVLEITAAKSDALTKLERHLLLLRQDPHKFVTSSNGRIWRVPFKALTRLLIQVEIENCITMKYGTVASQIVRILRRAGKLEEKHIASHAFQKPKNLRLCIAQMVQDRIIECQEIPKDKHYTLMKSNWVYSYDIHNARQQLLEMSYKIQSRLLQRLQVEYAQEALLMEKAERSDVRQEPNKYLSSREREKLEIFLFKEERLLTELSRIDDFVALLRDYSPMDWQADNTAINNDAEDTYYGKLFGAYQPARAAHTTDLEEESEDDLLVEDDEQEVL